MTDGDTRETVLDHYFRLLNEQRIDDLIELYAHDGVMITQGGTKGEPVQGRSALKEFYSATGHALVVHTITGSAQSASHSFVEGIVRRRDGSGDTKFFMASASTDADKRISRYTTLVWPGTTAEQVEVLVGQAVP